MSKALVQGRFNPLHNGHIYLLEHACKNNDIVKIAKGTAQKSYTTKNPCTWQEVKEMFDNLKNPKLEFYSIMDIHDRKNWVKHIQDIVGDFDVVYLGPDNPDKELYEKEGHKVITIPKTHSICGTSVREKIAKGEQYKHLIPETTQKVIDKYSIEERIKVLNKIYRNPPTAVDLVLEYQGGLVLVKRKNPPYGWALPGGFQEMDESLENTAVREAKEETGLDIKPVKQLKVYSEPNRDPRMHVNSVAFIAKGYGKLKAGDDAKEARIATLDNLPELLFDHPKRIEEYRRYKNG